LWKGKGTRMSTCKSCFFVCRESMDIYWSVRSILLNLDYCTLFVSVSRHIRPTCNYIYPRFFILWESFALLWRVGVLTSLGINGSGHGNPFRELNGQIKIKWSNSEVLLLFSPDQNYASSNLVKISGMDWTF